MKVLIVAKTRMGSGACIGAISAEGRSLRLVAADQESNEQFNMEYQVGEVWQVAYCQPAELIPPHVENIVVHDKRRLRSLDHISPVIERLMPPAAGGLEALFQGLTLSTQAGALYICQRQGLPPCSTMFWQPDKPLRRDVSSKRIHYRYPLEDGFRTLTFVGFQEPVAELPEGTILRVSLAHWWRPTGMPEGELRCYVQLSGWFPRALRRTRARNARATPRQATKETRSNHGTEALGLLKHQFGYHSFRPLQREIIEGVLAKQDALVVMPTGSGKSLCFQLPALLFEGLTLVASPLISLMEDQVAQLRELGVAAAYLNSSLTYDQYLAVTEQIRAGQVKLLYAAPETLLRPETLLLLEQVQVDCFTIDESHCISEWGHEFRPEYRELLDVRKRLPDAACLAVTATATQQVRQDIKRNLNMPQAGEFVASFDRPNLFLAVEAKHDLLAQTLAFLERRHGESGIIYCATRAQVDTLASQLAERGWPALPYHAGLDHFTRRKHQRRFSRDDVPIIVATIAFGMGINKSNVRFVLHVDLPKNLESYYQQIGRAGRDGLPADCLLLYSSQDIGIIRRFIQEQEDADQRIAASLRLETMLGYAESNLCRRRPLLAYFGESYPFDNCSQCDNCTVSQEELVDLTAAAQKFLSCVMRTGQIFGASHIIDVLRGSQSQKIRSRGHHQLSTHGIGREFDNKEWRYLARQFVQLGLLSRDMNHGSLELTGKGMEVLRGEPVWGALPDKPTRRIRETPRDYDLLLFERLRAKRKALADEANLPPYVIFHDKTLVEMATQLPRTPDQMGRIYGVGATKLAKYADAFLPIIQAHGVQAEPGEGE